MAVQAVGTVAAEYLKQTLKNTSEMADGDSFQAVFQSALGMLNEANDLQSAAEAEELNMALGYADNSHDLGIALSKADFAVQYTVAVKNKVLEAYREIMNLQV